MNGFPFYNRDLFSCLCQYLDPPDVLSLSEVDMCLQKLYLSSPVKSFVLDEKALYLQIKSKIRVKVKRWYVKTHSRLSL